LQVIALGLLSARVVGRTRNRVVAGAQGLDADKNFSYIGFMPLVLNALVLGVAVCAANAIRSPFSLPNPEGERG
jgi:hypothetical protein